MSDSQGSDGEAADSPAVQNRGADQELTAAPIPGMIGDGAAMREVYRMIRLVAPTRASVLIVGETGTGKELVARAIHVNSPRHDGPYVRVNCGALSESLLESELFGHVKGAFTGAVDNKTGRFEAAHGGTIFLDEISSMSHKLQVKLLRVLQEREFERVGDSRTIRVDARLVAATNRHLEDEIDAGRFRDDLYFRLNVVPIYIPPLRDRREDVPSLANFFLQRYSAENRKTIRGFDPACLDAMCRYDWPGNVRELENYVERAVVLAQGDRVTADLLPPQVRGESAPRIIRTRSVDLPAAVGDLVRLALQSSTAEETNLYEKVVGAVERELIEQVLTASDQVQIKAAARLGINRNTLHKKLKEMSAFAGNGVAKSEAASAGVSGSPGDCE
jgi:DNA-binding NtrC family response regulator